MAAVTFTHRTLVILMLGATVACGGRSPATVAPAPAAPEATVEQFLSAVRDADLGRMAELWGNERGPSTVSSRSSLQARQRVLTIMQRVLQSDEHRVVGAETPPARPDWRILQVEMVRAGRRFVVPFTLVMARSGGWLILAVGIDAAMPPAAGPGSP